MCEKINKKTILNIIKIIILIIVVYLSYRYFNSVWMSFASFIITSIILWFNRVLDNDEEAIEGH